MGRDPHGRQLFVRTLSKSRSRGCLQFGALRFPCALGANGIRVLKREGDGATPLGTFRCLKAYYRPDRMMRPRTGLPIAPLRPRDGWCDAPRDRNYNRRVRHPYPQSAEHLWRDDGVYDVIVVLDQNTCPRIRYRGSAVFLHMAREGYTPTAGCVALKGADLLKLLRCIDRHVTIRVVL